MKFNHLNVPTHWQNYWTRFPEGHTIIEALIQWVSQVDSMVDNQNKLNDNVEQFRNKIDEFVGRFDERLQTEVTQTLTDWQNSGFLDVVISEALQWQLDDYIATNEQDKLSLTAQLQHNPDDYEGTDREKIQQAVDYILENNYQGGIIRLSRMYDLTGESPIMIDKVEYPTRRPITFKGASGGIVKRDAGFIFSTNVVGSGDIYLDNLVFEGSAEKVVVFDNDKLIRTFINMCHFRFISAIFYAPERYIQTAYLTDSSVVGGRGYLIEAKQSFDLSVTGSLIEHRESFINQLVGLPAQQFTSTRIIDNVIEGFTEKMCNFIKINALLIDGNYFEGNKRGYIFFDALADLENVTISNNMVSHGVMAVDSGFEAFVHWGGDLKNALSSNNYVHDIKIHNTTNVKTGTVLVTTEKIDVNDPLNIIRYLDKHRLKEISLAGGPVRQAIYPTMTKSFRSYTASMGVGVVANIYNLGFTIKTDDLISIQLRNNSGTSDASPRLLNYFANDGKLRVALLNETQSPIDFTIFITVLSVGIGLDY